MARYTKAVCRLCRREGTKLYLKGERCFTDKCAVTKRPGKPGEHSQERRGKMSDHGLQLREKQKVRRTYGLQEKQFRKYFKEAEKKQGITGENFLKMLESRLDNVIFRLNLARSRPEARQIVLHGHVLVNGRRVNIPSFLVKEGDVISIKEKSRGMSHIKDILEVNEGRGVPSWLEVDLEKATGKVLGEPRREDLDMEFEEHLIVEYYSR